MKTKNIFKSIILLYICLSLLIGCDNVEYNNTTNYNDIVTKMYTIQEMEDFEEQSRLGVVTFSDFKKCFDVECIRKTTQGYYCILRLNGEKNAYVFFNHDLKLTYIIIAKEFISKDEFDNVLINKTTKSQILSLDPNTISLPVSAISTTAHIVNDGMLVITYSPYVVEGAVVTDPTVKSIKFFSDKELLSYTNDIVSLAPVVLPIDK